MKRYGFFLWLILLPLIPACKSQPPAEEPGPERAEILRGEADTGAAETAETPSPETPGGDAGGEGDFPADLLAEPEPEPAETETGLLPPAAEPSPALPEPDAPALFRPPEPPAAPREENAPAKPEAPVESPPAAPPLPPAPAPPPALGSAEEALPSRLRPAEEEPAGIVREPEPRQVTPPPASPEPEIRPLAPPLAAIDEGLVFSRIVRATVGQLVEIPFRGTGWVYLGELGARRGLAYDSRRLDSEGQSFIFRAEAAGIYALKFYKQDFIRDYILNDYVQVAVGEAPEGSAAGWFTPPVDRGRVSAERWPSALEEADAAVRSRSGSAAGSPVPPADAPPAAGSASAPESPVPPADAPPAAGSASAPDSSVPPAGQPPEAPSAGVGTPPPARPGISDEGIIPVRPPAAAGQAGTVPPAAPPVSPRALPPEGSLPEDYLRTAQEEFNAGRVAGAIAALDQFRDRFPAGSDEAWWLYGQFYEANSPSRDIRAALDYYRRLVREYPQSRRYTDARRRIAYLERYYINIQ